MVRMRSPVRIWLGAPETKHVWAFSSAGRASALQAEGRRFEPVNAHQSFLWSDGRVGRRRSPAKRVYGYKPYRRFESVSLRQNRVRANRLRVNSYP